VGHGGTFLSAFVASGGTCLAMLGFVPSALIAAGLADLRAQRTNRLGVFASARHHIGS